MNGPINSPAQGAFFVKLRSLPRTDRGRRHALRATCPDWTITMAANYVNSIGLDTLIETWLAEEFPGAASGRGPKMKVTPRTYLVALIACCLAGLDVSMTQIHHVITGELTKTARAALGLKTSRNDLEDARLDKLRRHDIGYDCVTRTAAKVALTIDPRPYPTRRALGEDEIAKITATFIPEVVTRRQRRADHLSALMLTACFRMLPPDLAARWSGDITLDGTVVPTYGREGNYSPQRVVALAHSPEVNAGWHAKTQKNREGANKPGKAKANKEYTFGYDAHLALMTGDPDGPDFPRLILGLTLDRPGVEPGPNAVTALAGIIDQGLPAGRLTVDMGYSQLAAENFHLPARALGYELVMMYRSDQLGIQGSIKGMVLIEGALHCPSTPKALVEASIDYAKERIDRETYEARIVQRQLYKVRSKDPGNHDGDVSVSFRCPAQGQHRTVECELKPAPVEKGVRKALPVIVNPPKYPTSICTNNESVTIPAAWGAKWLQPLYYKSPEWSKYYATARNEMEGKNRYVKNQLDADIAAVDQRRFRGYGKQLLVLVSKIVAANVDTILAWIDREEDGRNEPPRKKRGRPKTIGLERYRPDPNGPPLRIVGPPTPEEFKPAA